MLLHGSKKVWGWAGLLPESLTLLSMSEARLWVRLLEPLACLCLCVHKYMLHWGFEGRKATAGNLAFPFSPSDLPFDGGMLTVCGTRDPFFIAQWPAIQQDVRAYVSSLSSCDGLSIRFISAGLPGLPRIHVTETDDVHQVSDECWRCDTMAAEYTLQHLVDLDEELMRSMFSIKLWHADGVDTLQAELVPWGDNRIMSTELAYSDWTNSLKPVGSRVFGQTLGDLARVVRSKNAGVNEITFDLIFDTDEGALFDVKRLF
ncbi:unnamed protein product [Durusdinium trenchii]|uniref:DUF4387 domain-containing protein n=1 Tax=Durusdinium trenchii TaxID=1381693 RepID=A0ABP0R2P9_9DINO